MKMNKIISAMLAVAMLSTSIISVSAAKVELTQDGSTKVVSAMPSRAEVEARMPVLTFENVTELADYDAVRTAAGTSFAKKTKQNGSYDVYQLTMRFSNIGELVNGWDESWEYTSFCGIGNITVGIKGFEEAGFLALFKEGLGEGTYTNNYFTPVEGSPYVNISWQAASANTNPYPTYNADAEGDAAYIPDQPLDLPVFFAFPEGSTVTLDADNFEKLFVNYMVTVDGACKSVPIDLAAPTYTFGEKKPSEPIEIVGDRYDLTDGFAWDVQVNEYAPAKTYTATFTDVATAETKINDFNFSNYVEAEEGATFAFVTLLKTTKKNVNLVVSAK